MTPLLLAALVVTQAGVLATWHRSLGVPGAVGGSVVAGAAAIAADVLALYRSGDRPLSDVPAVLALAVLAALVHQLARRDGRDRLTASLTATVSLTALAALGSAYIAALDIEDGPELVSASVTAAVLVVAGVAVRHRLGGSHRPAIPQDLLVVLLPVVGAAGAASLAVVALDGLQVVPVMSVSLASAVLAWVAAMLVARTPGPASAHRSALGVALPVLVAGPVAYVLGRLLVG